MNSEQHQTKAERIERSLAKCESGDYEMRIEAAMLAGTHWTNFILHRLGITGPDQDVVHTYLLTLNELRKYTIAAETVMQKLERIENLRPAFVRGNWPGGLEAAEHALQHLNSIRLVAWRLKTFASRSPE